MAMHPIKSHTSEEFALTAENCPPLSPAIMKSLERMANQLNLEAYLWDENLKELRSDGWVFVPGHGFYRKDKGEGRL